MFILYHFGLKSIWNFYEVKFYFSDTGFRPFCWCFVLKRHLAKSHMIIFKALVSSFKTCPPTANLTKKSTFKKVGSNLILWMWISFVFMIHFKLMYSNVSWLQIVIILSCSRDMKWQFGAFNAFLWPNAHEPWELQHHKMKSNKRSHRRSDARWRWSK